jgi:hypothetical protein
MERPEQQEARVCKAEQETSLRLMESVREDFKPAGGSALNIDRESQRVANIFDLGNNPGNQSFNEKIVQGAERLSKDLQQLSGNMTEYNKLLQQVADKIPDEPAANPYPSMHNWNSKTGTYKDVSIMSGDGLEAYRIVQPGNTFNQIARDTYNGFVKAAGEDGFQGFDEYRQSLITMNRISDPSRVYVGQAIKLRDSFFWS